MWAEWSYNTSYHSATGMTLFEVTFGRKPPSIPQYLTGSSKLEAIDDLLSQREEVFELLRRKLLKAQDRMKVQADKHRRDTDYQVGEKVWVKLRPYRQTSTTGEPYSKLGKQYFGPFEITEKLGKVAYQLKLPDDAKIHPEFHVSVLKKFFNKGEQLTDMDLPPLADTSAPTAKPLAVVASKIVPSNSGPRRMVLVQWQNEPLEEASWEDWSVLKDTYHLEDKVVFKEEGNATYKSDQGVQGAQEEEHRRDRHKHESISPAHLKDFIRY